MTKIAILWLALHYNLDTVHMARKKALTISIVLRAFLWIKRERASMPSSMVWLNDRKHMVCERTYGKLVEQVALGY